MGYFLFLSNVLIVINCLFVILFSFFNPYMLKGPSAHPSAYYLIIYFFVGCCMKNNFMSAFGHFFPDSKKGSNNEIGLPVCFSFTESKGFIHRISQEKNTSKVAWVDYSNQRNNFSSPKHLKIIIYYQISWTQDKSGL